MNLFHFRSALPLRAALIAALLALALAATACGPLGDDVLEGSGEISSEEFPVDGATEVILAGSGDIEISIGSEEGLTVHADSNVIDNVRAETRGEVLEISLYRGTYDEIRPTRLEYELVLSDLASLEIQGSGNALVAPLDTENFEAAISGSGQVSLPDLTCESATVDISGSGTAELAGRCASLRAMISGSGALAAAELEAETAEVDIGGSGEARVWATDTLTVDVSGSGHVYYVGNPEPEVSISGSGSVEPLGP